MKRRSNIIVTFLVIITMFISSNAIAKKKFSNKDTWTYKGVSIAEKYPGLQHYIWETERPPYGPFDKIALHRLVHSPKNWKAIPNRPSPNKKKVIFIIPGTWSRGSSSIDDERNSLNIFLANRGYDVYSMDFRTSYLPNLAYVQFQEYGYDVSSTSDWTYGVFREDIKSCVDMAKSISRAKKIFLAGRSRGGTQMWIYASKYWRKDLKGLIGLDGGPPFPSSTPPRSKEDYDDAIEAFKAGGMYLSEVSGYEQSNYAGVVPYSPNAVGFESLEAAVLATATNYPWATYPPPEPVETVSDLVAYGAHFAWGDGIVTNYYGGFIDLDILIKVESNFTRYWPGVQNVEQSNDLDYAENDAEINIPIIYFGGKLGCPGGSCLIPGLPIRAASTDVTILYLEDFGHLDVYVGKYSFEEVSEPLLEWLNQRK
ncbi:MAG: hypothetical protein ACQ9MH_21215 [Nitrospinales bacterium]